MDNKILCIQLVYADNEIEVISLLKKAGYWDNNQHWIYYGARENNFKTEEKWLHI